jgi:repressor of nif and glnA expression
MTEEEDKIMELLRQNGEMSTTEIESEFTRKGESCPDGAVKHLMKMKTRGMVEEKMDRKKKGWVWSLKL